MVHAIGVRTTARRGSSARPSAIGGCRPPRRLELAGCAKWLRGLSAGRSYDDPERFATCRPRGDGQPVRDPQAERLHALGEWPVSRPGPSWWPRPSLSVSSPPAPGTPGGVRVQTNKPFAQTGAATWCPHILQAEESVAHGATGGLMSSVGDAVTSVPVSASEGMLASSGQARGAPWSGRREPLRRLALRDGRREAWRSS